MLVEPPVEILPDRVEAASPPASSLDSSAEDSASEEASEEAALEEDASDALEDSAVVLVQPTRHIEAASAAANTFSTSLFFMVAYSFCSRRRPTGFHFVSLSTLTG